MNPEIQVYNYQWKHSKPGICLICFGMYSLRLMSLWADHKNQIWASISTLAFTIGISVNLAIDLTVNRF